MDTDKKPMPCILRGPNPFILLSVSIGVIGGYFAFSGAMPMRILRTGTSIFLPVSVNGMAST